MFQMVPIMAQAQCGLNNHSRTKAHVSLKGKAKWKVSGQVQWSGDPVSMSHGGLRREPGVTSSNSP